MAIVIRVGKHKGSVSWREERHPDGVTAPGHIEVVHRGNAVFISVQSFCATCQAEKVQRARKVFPGGTKGDDPQVPDDLKGIMTFYCECGASHPDRPATAVELGCGRYWYVDVR